MIEQNRHPDAALAHARLPEVDPDTLGAVHQLLALADHAADNAADDLLPLVFAPGALVAPSGDPTRSHHTVAPVVRRGPDGSPRSWSRLLSVTDVGAVYSADVLDELEDGPGGWRIARRWVLPRHGAAHDLPPSW